MAADSSSSGVSERPQTLRPSIPFFVNCDGEMLTGDRPEVFVFPYEPENVREFWSVTRYSLLTRNTLPGLKDLFNAYNTEPDDAGNVTITFSAEDPADGTHLMPVIEGGRGLKSLTAHSEIPATKRICEPRGGSSAQRSELGAELRRTHDRLLAESQVRLEGGRGLGSIPSGLFAAHGVRR